MTMVHVSSLAACTKEVLLWPRRMMAAQGAPTVCGDASDADAVGRQGLDWGVKSTQYCTAHPDGRQLMLLHASCMLGHMCCLCSLASLSWAAVLSQLLSNITASVSLREASWSQLTCMAKYTFVLLEMTAFRAWARGFSMIS